MNHETLQALYALDVAEVGEEEAAKRWEYLFHNNWFDCPTKPRFKLNTEYRRKPDLPWPKVMQPEFEEWIKHYKKQHHPKCDLLEAAGFDSMGNKCTCLECIKNDLQNATHEWPADAPAWATCLISVYNDQHGLKTGRTQFVDFVERPKPKDYCGVCGEWFGGPVECCGESHLKPPVTKDEAVAVRAARKPAVKKIAWIKLPLNVHRHMKQKIDEGEPLSDWIAWNCDEHTRGNPLPDGLVVEGINIGDKGFTWEIASEELNWEHVRCFRIVGIQEGWE